jgi:RES domain.
VRLAFRHADARYPFFWEVADQPAARWHRDGAGPVQYLADTSDGAWAEFLRHEEITDPEDLAGIARSIWAVELPEDIDIAEPVTMPEATGGLDSYRACQTYAAHRRTAGVRMLRAPSAALLAGGAHGQVTDGGLQDAPGRDGIVWVLFGRYPRLRGWRVAARGRPEARLLSLVRPLAAAN